MTIVLIFVGFLVGIFVRSLISICINIIEVKKNISKDNKITNSYFCTKTIDDKYINSGTSYTGKEENIKVDKDFSHTGN